MRHALRCLLSKDETRDAFSVKKSAISQTSTRFVKFDPFDGWSPHNTAVPTHMPRALKPNLSPKIPPAFAI